MINPIREYLDKFKFAIMAVLLVALVGSALANYWQYQQALQAAKDYGVVKSAVDERDRVIVEQKAAIDTLDKHFGEMQEKLSELAKVNGALESSVASQKQVILGYKDRENVAHAKPGLVGRLINNASNVMFNDLACKTGDQNRCDKNAAPK